MSRSISAFSKGPVTYKLVWKGEVIEEELTREEAEYLQGEYTLAYGSPVSIKKER